MADYKKIENYISNIATIWHNAGMEASIMQAACFM